VLVTSTRRRCEPSEILDYDFELGKSLKTSFAIAR